MCEINLLVNEVMIILIETSIIVCHSHLFGSVLLRLFYHLPAGTDDQNSINGSLLYYNEGVPVLVDYELTIRL